MGFNTVSTLVEMDYIRSMNGFYVYMYSDQGGVPFYIGKGSGQRYRLCRHAQDKHKFLMNKILAVGVNNVRITFLHRDLTEPQALYLEEYYIAGIGRRDLGLGPLVNLTNGGEGMSGRSMSEVTKRKISEKLVGRFVPDNIRDKISAATRAGMTPVVRMKISNAMKGNQYTLGHVHTDTHKQRISASIHATLNARKFDNINSIGDK